MDGKNYTSRLPFGTYRASEEDQLSPEVWRVGLKLYRKAWDAYKEAGCPFGETDEAMLVWYAFQGEKDDQPEAVGNN